MTELRPIIAVLNDWGYSIPEVFDDLGATVLDVQYLHEVSRAVKNADAIVLTGGGDVDPMHYGAEDKHPQVYGLSADRDTMELLALNLARKYRVPVLGICRGHQLINVSWGGSLHQHLSDGVDGLHKHSSCSHDVKLRHSSFVGRKLRSSILRSVTSLHHQAVDRLGDGLVPVGWSTDGTVEMIETAPGVKPYMLGTQFHPEMDVGDVKPEYDALGIFKLIYEKARQHCASVGNSRERNEAVEDLETSFKLHYARTIKGLSSPSQTSVIDYLDAIPGSVVGSETDYWTEYETEDSYEDWQQRNRMQLSQRLKTSQYTIETADSLCTLKTGCKSPMDCLSYGDCAADVMKGVVRQAAKGASK